MGKGGYNGGSTVIHAGSGWFGKGSITSQPADKKKKPPAPAKPNQKKKAKKGSLGGSSKGNGLTRADIVAKAAQKVRTIESEIAKTKQRLAALERDLAQATVDVKAAQSLPAKTALGLAHQSAKRPKTSHVPIEERVAGKLVGKRIVERS